MIERRGTGSVTDGDANLRLCRMTRSALRCSPIRSRATPSYVNIARYITTTDFTPPFFTLSRYDDVIEALRDVETWSMRYGPSPQYTRPSGLVNDPPEHTEFRRLFHRGFTPRTVGGLEEEITALAVELLDAMAPLGRGDFHEHYAVRLPITVIARMLGVPEADHALFKDMTDTLVATYNEPDPRASAAPSALRFVLPTLHRRATRRVARRGHRPSRRIPSRHRRSQRHGEWIRRGRIPRAAPTRRRDPLGVALAAARRQRNLDSAADQHVVAATRRPRSLGCRRA